MRAWAVTGCVVATLTLAACSSSPAPPATPLPSTPTAASAAPSPNPSSTIATATLRCSDVVGTDPPSADLRQLEGVVAFPSTSQPALQTSQTGAAGKRRLFAKFGLLVRAGQSMVIVASDPDHVAMGWGNPGTITSALIIPGCPEPANSSPGSEWLAFAGGYYVDRPQCIGLIVTRAGQEHTVRIGVGAPCPDQQPPPSPSDS